MNSIFGKVCLVVAGGVVGFLTAKVVYAKYYENLVETELNSIRDAYTNALQEIKTQAIIENTEKKITPNKSTGNKNGSLVRSDEGNQYNQIKKIYDIDQDDSGHPADEEDEDVVGDEYLEETAYGNPVEVLNTAPYIINEHSFSYEFEQNDKVSMDFYMDDKILTDEVGDELDIQMVMKMIGADAYEQLCAAKTDIVIFVRNEKLRTDYEIGSIDASYEEDHAADEEFILERKTTQKNLTPREAFEARQKDRGEGK